MDNELQAQVKNIVEPYEKRIKELEEIIRTKDFEIAVLKQKIYNLNKDQKENNDNAYDNKQKENMINVKFIDFNNKLITMKCNELYKARIVFENYLHLNEKIRLELRNLNFTCNNNPLKSYLSLKENGIADNSIIYVYPKRLMNLVFESTNSRRPSVPLTYDENISVGMAFIYYLIYIQEEEMLINILNKKRVLSFISNSTEFKINDETPIKNRFRNGVKILVIAH